MSAEEAKRCKLRRVFTSHNEQGKSIGMFDDTESANTKSDLKRLVHQKCHPKLPSTSLRAGFGFAQDKLREGSRIKLRFFAFD
jgi:hypothetical protein